MRSSIKGSVCTYGLNNQAGYLFERNQDALRQRSFGRARGIPGTPLKRFRDQSSDTDEEAHRHLRMGSERRVVLDGFKRMRVSSPTESPESDVDLDMTDEEVVTPRTTWRANKAIVPVTSNSNKRPLQFTASAPAESWKMMHRRVSGHPMEISDVDSCRAMVVFNPYQSMNLSPTPRVDLVEDKENETTSSSESDEEHGVRFEELTSDNDEPVDMDID
ncbi:unnamed protein product [Peronospora belbahrii]|uniref:Uncharacterized protein n=1 Tax=Peronospora belbahrii TaxID=622444 RepID=A0AAU9KRM0_9STRA|nr:unnamed protein product [Peronospora belbahrii]CAH0518903.1 unnamed protein product [Peronospora belbahrii]